MVILLQHLNGLKKLLNCSLLLGILLGPLSFIVFEESSVLASPSSKNASEKGTLANARDAFEKKAYDKAVTHYRQYLRQNKHDYNVWNELAASYFHSGLPRKALRYLRSVQKKTTSPSYNLYYQGLCYQVLDQKTASTNAFASAARYTDEYGSRATFEMALLEYNSRNVDRAKYWLLLYIQRYPTGVYRPQVDKMLESFRSGQLVKDIKGIEKPDMDNAIYRYSPLSLSQNPHYWFTNVGYTMTTKAGQEPTQDGGVKPVNSEQQGIIAEVGLGAGPVQANEMTAWAGYNYRQLWLTDSDRLDVFLGDPGDLEYQPFRADYLIRRHQFYGDVRRKVGSDFYLGVFARMEFARTGSSFMPVPREDQDLQRVLKLSDTQVLVPWVGISYYDHFRTLFYFYFRKELNDETPEFSNKTYSLGGDGGGDGPTLSYGITHSMDFPEYRLESEIELFQYELIFNDFWLDYTRLGGTASLTHEFLPKFFATGLIGMYEDKYQLPRLKMRPSCATASQPSETGSNQEITPTKCYRSDSGMIMQAGIYWNYTQFYRVGAYYEYIKNENGVQKEFDEQKSTFKVLVTVAFPSVKRVSRFIEKSADSPFNKEVQ